MQQKERLIYLWGKREEMFSLEGRREIKGTGVGPEGIPEEEYKYPSGVPQFLFPTSFPPILLVEIPSPSGIKPYSSPILTLQRTVRNSLCGSILVSPL